MTKEMVNNFETIKDLLEFKPGYVYEVQIIARKKDGAAISNSKTIKTYYVRSLDYLAGKMDEIVGMCEYFNARAYITLSPKAGKDIVLSSINVATELLRSGNTDAIGGIPSKAFGAAPFVSKTKLFLVDLDPENIEWEEDIKNAIFNSEPVGEKIVAEIPTKNGKHLIVKPFNRKKFNEYMDGSIQTKDLVHDTATTILYVK